MVRDKMYTSNYSLSHIAQLYLRRPKVIFDFWLKVLMMVFELNAFREGVRKC